MIDLLVDKIQALQNPTVVGLDPRLSMIPEHIRQQAFETYGPVSYTHLILTAGPDSVEPQVYSVLINVRLPRINLAVLCGAGLAVSGLAAAGLATA